MKNNSIYSWESPFEIKQGWAAVLLLFIGFVAITVFKINEFSNAKHYPTESKYEIELNRRSGGAGSGTSGTTQLKEKKKVGIEYFLIMPLIAFGLLTIRVLLRQFATSLFIVSEKVDGLAWTMLLCTIHLVLYKVL